RVVFAARRFVDNDAREVALGRQVVHDVQEHLLQDRAQTAGARLAGQRLRRDRPEGAVADLELDPFHAEHLLILLGERILGLNQDLDQRRLIELLERRDAWQAAQT